jgi:hypothetical protein
MGRYPVYASQAGKKLLLAITAKVQTIVMEGL